MSFTSTNTTVHIEDLQLEGYVGHHAPEREQLQIVRVSITCTLTNPDVLNDLLKNSFDYVPVVREVRALAIQKKRRLIETFAEEIAGCCFSCPHVETVVVSVRKPRKLPGVRAVGTTRTFIRS